MNRRYKNLLDRILTNCIMEDRGLSTRGACWSWLRYKSKEGYGRITVRVNNRPRGKWVHRLMYALVVGEIPERATLDHTCYNKACCNPQHLEVITREENSRRRWQRLSRSDDGRWHAARSNDVHV